MTASTNSTNDKQNRAPLIWNSFCMGCLGLQCPGLWSHPDDKSRDFNTIEYWVNLAQLLEKGKFNALFIADVLGPYDVYDGPGNFRSVAKVELNSQLQNQVLLFLQWLLLQKYWFWDNIPDN